MYNFFIDDLQLPVAPSSMQTQINNKNETITLMNDGEVNILKKPGLTDIEFEVLLPNVQYPFAIYTDGFKPATFYLEKFEKLKVEQESFQFIVNRMMPNGKLLFDTNMTVSLEEYSIEEDANNGFDLMVTISLKQYRPYGNKKVEIKQSSTSSTKKATVKKQRKAPSKPKVKTHKVVPGDTLWAIAKRYLGNGARYPELARINNIKNPNLIFPGQVIKLG
ncbi:LysM peptidoglycan-binding domain-containing protein [Gracilibacillus dipsosauri]|uniref:LysM peptidoglycan-binding domain-containing protein n=1 Tax=Gracilibacillus dipsosauri TaxID=178340 RepID=UPI00240937CE